MSINRLQLDFSLSSRQERLNFIRNYLNTIRFKPNEHELDTMAKYILWGKNDETGLNGRQEGLELETKHRTWDATHLESLDALIESPNFSETIIRGPSNPPTKFTRQTFSREKARKEAPPYILARFEQLWRRIDETDLLTVFYEIHTGKRINPPRKPLLDAFSPEEIDKIEQAAYKLEPYRYLKLKHELVELRREQFVLKDSYCQMRASHPTFSWSSLEGFGFGAEIKVLPLGIPAGGELGKKIFNEDRFPSPEDFGEKELEAVSEFLWENLEKNKKEKKLELAHEAADTKFFFDFRDEKHLYALFNMWDVLEEIDENIFSTKSLFMRAAHMYKNLANLDEMMREILEMKINKVQNQDIANYINKKYGKTYRANYISTLYCKKCLSAIAAAATKHREVMENIFFPENFKKCKDCGLILLRDSSNFMKRSRSTDGFSPRCKRCEKIKRNGKRHESNK